MQPFLGSFFLELLIILIILTREHLGVNHFCSHAGLLDSFTTLGLRAGHILYMQLR